MKVNRVNYNKVSQQEESVKNEKEIKSDVVEVKNENVEKEKKIDEEFVEVINCASLNIRESNSISSNIIEVVDLGEKLKKIGHKVGNFIPVVSPSGKNGYVMIDYVK